MRPVQGKTKIKRSGIHGYGVFALKDIRTGEVIEMMPALAVRHDHLSQKGRKDGPLNTHTYHPTELHEVWIGTGTSSFYNAARNFNADIEYEWDEGDWIRIVARRGIRLGEEITLDYLQDQDS